MSDLDSDYKDALRYAIKNCPARTTGQLAAIEFAERAIREDLSVLTTWERRTLILELGLWLTRYQRIREFSASSEALAPLTRRHTENDTPATRHRQTRPARLKPAR